MIRTQSSTSTYCIICPSCGTKDFLDDDDFYIEKSSGFLISHILCINCSQEFIVEKNEG